MVRRSSVQSLSVMILDRIIINSLELRLTYQTPLRRCTPRFYPHQGGTISRIPWFPEFEDNLFSISGTSHEALFQSSPIHLIIDKNPWSPFKNNCPRQSNKQSYRERRHRHRENLSLLLSRRNLVKCFYYDRIFCNFVLCFCKLWSHLYFPSSLFQIFKKSFNIVTGWCERFRGIFSSNFPLDDIASYNMCHIVIVNATK